MTRTMTRTDPSAAIINNGTATASILRLWDRSIESSTEEMSALQEDLERVESDQSLDDDLARIEASWLTPAGGSAWAFIVANCGEWSEGRARKGDIALADALVTHGGVAAERVVHLSDEKTRKDCMVSAFLEMLGRTSENDNLIVYYGAVLVGSVG